MSMQSQTGVDLEDTLKTLEELSKWEKELDAEDILKRHEDTLKTLEELSKWEKELDAEELSKWEKDFEELDEIFKWEIGSEALEEILKLKWEQEGKKPPRIVVERKKMS